PVEVLSAAPRSRGLRVRRDALGVRGALAHELADHLVVAHAGRVAALAVLPVLHLARLGERVVEDPLLRVAAARPARHQSVPARSFAAISADGRTQAIVRERSSRESQVLSAPRWLPTQSEAMTGR